MIYFQ
jgi:hydroxymethylglutaryl-CoA lyase